MKKRCIAILLLSAFLVLSLSSTTFADEDFDRAVELYSTGKYERAIDVLKDYVQQKPEPAAYWMIGYALYKLKRFEEADKYFNDAYLIDPNFSPKQIAAFAPAVEAEIQKALKEFEKEITIPEKKGPEMPTFELTPGEVQGLPGTQAQQKVQPPAPQQVQPTAPPAQPQVTKPAQPPAPTAPPAQPQVAQPARPPAQQQVQPTAPPQPRPPVTQPVRPPVRTMPRTAPQQIPGMPPEAGALIAMMAGFATIFLIAGIVIYLVYSLCLFMIAKKLDVAASWLAFIPILQIWPFVGAAGKPWWWILILFFVPIINLIVFIWFWMLIAENLGKSKAFGLLTALLLMFLPVIGLIMPAILAFSKSGGTAAAGGEDYGTSGLGGGESFGSPDDFGGTLDMGGEGSDKDFDF